jgi:hypothetical protein
MSTPTRRTPSGCCARTANGHAAAAPSPAMNSRRRIDHLPKLRTAYRVLASRRWPPRARRWGAAVATQVSRHFFRAAKKVRISPAHDARSGRCRQMAYLRGGAAEDSRHSQPRGGGAGEIEIEFVVERRVDRAGRYAYEERAFTTAAAAMLRYRPPSCSNCWPRCSDNHCPIRRRSCRSCRREFSSLSCRSRPLSAKGAVVADIFYCRKNAYETSPTKPTAAISRGVAMGRRMHGSDMFMVHDPVWPAMALAR